VWQNSCNNSGLIEGIADWVRLVTGFAASHWQLNKNGSWDSGYQQTAFFLKWIDDKYENFVPRLNILLETVDQCSPEKAFDEILSKSVVTLWSEYVKSN
jgi:hypothetical protein